MTAGEKLSCYLRKIEVSLTFSMKKRSSLGIFAIGSFLPHAPFATRARASELNHWPQRTSERSGCILRLTGKANWSFGGGVS
jgi:hypothetical protein